MCSFRCYSVLQQGPRRSTCKWPLGRPQHLWQLDAWLAFKRIYHCATQHTHTTCGCAAYGLQTLVGRMGSPTGPQGPHTTPGSFHSMPTLMLQFCLLLLPGPRARAQHARTQHAEHPPSAAVGADGPGGCHVSFPRALGSCNRAPHSGVRSGTGARALMSTWSTENRPHRREAQTRPLLLAGAILGA